MEAKLSQQTADYILKEIKEIWFVSTLKDIEQILKSLVSEDIRNHHRGTCFRVNDTDLSKDECTGVEFTKGCPKCEAHLLEQED